MYQLILVFFPSSFICFDFITFQCDGTKNLQYQVYQQRTMPQDRGRTVKIIFSSNDYLYLGYYKQLPLTY